MSDGEAQEREALRLAELNAKADERLRAYVSSSLVLLFEVDAQGATTTHGSGSLLRASSGRTCVLTAAHVVDGTRPVALLHAGGRYLDAVESVVRAPKRVDVALAVLRDLPGIAHFAVEPSRIASKDWFPVTKKDFLVVTGFSSQFAFERAGADPMDREHLFSDIAYFTHALGADRRAISIYWDKAEMRTDVDKFAVVGVPPSGHFDLKKPRGISGGAVWKVKPGDSKRPDAWSPEESARIVGVPHKYSGRRQLAVPAPLWRDWAIGQLLRV